MEESKNSLFLGADAICLAVTAKLKSEGCCETIPENPEMDNNGLYMKLTVPKKLQV